MLRRRIVMTLIGVTICGFSVGMFNFSQFGMDPFQTFAHGIWKHTSFSYGFVYMVINGIMCVLDWFLDKTKIGIGTFINLFLLGYVVDFSTALWTGLIPDPSTVVGFLFLLAGIVIMCLGSALYYTGNLGVSTYDAIPLCITERKDTDFRKVRISCDLICTLTGFLLGQMPGIGTIITAFFMGPLISFFNRTVAEPLLNGRK